MDIDDGPERQELESISNDCNMEPIIASINAGPYDPETANSMLTIVFIISLIMTPQRS